MNKQEEQAVYETPIVAVLRFTDDVIRTSGGDHDNPWNPDWGE